MKKFYTALALTAAVSVNAVAADLASKNEVNVLDRNLVANELQMNDVAKQNTMAKELNWTTADQIAGYYILECNSGFTQGDFTFSLYVEKGENNNEVVVYGLWNNTSGNVKAGGLGVKGTIVNNGEKTVIEFKKQKLASFQDGTEVYFYPYDPFQGGGVIDKMELTVCPYGLQTSAGEHLYEEGCLATLGKMAYFISGENIIGDQRGYALLYNLVLCPISLYGSDAQQIVTINENEWKSLGNGKFEDGYLYPLFEGQMYPAYDVEVLKKNDNTNVFLIKNPYGSGTPYASGNGDKTGNGYIYIDATNPDLVMVRPMLYSGFDDQANWEGRQYMANEEGVQYFLDESSIDDVKEYFEYYDIPTSSMVVNGNDVTINIRNGVLTGVADLFTYAPWTSQSGAAIPCESVLNFKNDNSGVEGVINDTENAAKRYFNLQGLEIANPAAGELVIVKQGNKTTKTIVK